MRESLLLLVFVLCMVESGPGFGPLAAQKAVLVSAAISLTDALQARRTATAWIRCDAADRDPGRLLRHLITALADAAPGVADRLHLGVRGRIGRGNWMVVAPADNFAGEFDDSADWHFTRLARAVRLDERGFHQLVECHRRGP